MESRNPDLSAPGSCRGLSLAALLAGMLACGIALSWPVAAAAAVSHAVSDELRLAYLDPGAGSFLVQALVAAAAGIAITVRLYWKRVKTLLGLSTEAEDEDGPAGGTPSGR